MNKKAILLAFIFLSGCDHGWDHDRRGWHDEEFEEREGHRGFERHRGEFHRGGGGRGFHREGGGGHGHGRH